jgi:hypothetical protein
MTKGSRRGSVSANTETCTVESQLQSLSTLCPPSIPPAITTEATDDDGQEGWGMRSQGRPEEAGDPPGTSPSSTLVPPSHSPLFLPNSILARRRRRHCRCAPPLIPLTGSLCAASQRVAANVDEQTSTSTNCRRHRRTPLNVDESPSTSTLLNDMDKRPTRSISREERPPTQTTALFINERASTSRKNVGRE